jgi:phosphoglycolate phosphatase-like HAD superfamily hydrolase
MATVGVLTRNSLDNALATLEHCGIAHHFADGCVIGRDEAPPKPSPDGIDRMLRGWDALPSSGVIFGDFL